MTTNETPDTINVDLPIEAKDDGRVSVGGATLSREYWRKAAVDPSSALTKWARGLAPAVVAWMDRDEWKPLDLPEVGRTIKATLRDGRVETFKVNEVEGGSNWVRVWKADSGDAARYIQRVRDVGAPRPTDIIAWDYVDEPAVNLAAITDKIAAAVNELREALGGPR